MKREIVICDLCDNVGEITPAIARITTFEGDEYDVCGECGIAVFTNILGINPQEPEGDK